MTDLAEHWLPPTAYPAVIDGPTDDGLFLVHLPDFGVGLTVTCAEDALDAATRAVHRHLRHRAANRQLFPFASEPSTVGEGLIMVSTAGWDRIEEAQDE